MSTLLHLTKTMLLNLVYATLETAEEPRESSHDSHYNSWKKSAFGGTHINIETGEYGWGFDPFEVKIHDGSESNDSDVY